MFQTWLQNCILLLCCLLNGCLSLKSQEYYIWRPMALYGGQTLHSLRIDPEIPSTLYLASQEAGIFKSEDYGQHWNGLAFGFQSASDLHILCLQTVQENAGHLLLLAGTERDNLGVMTSLNAGETWDTVAPVFTPALRDTSLLHSTVLCAVHPFQPDQIILAFPASGLYRSTDGGKKFQRITPEHQGVTAVYFDPENPGSLLVSAVSPAGSGIFRLELDASQWISLNEAMRPVDLKPDLLTPGVWYAVDQQRGVMRSHDSGRSWLPLNEHPSALTGPSQRCAVSSIDSTCLFTWNQDQQGYYYSADAGRHWQNKLASHAGIDWRGQCWEFYPFILSSLEGVAPDPFDQSIVNVYNRFGVWHSRDAGDHWSVGMYGITNQTITDLCFDPEIPERMYAVTQQGGVFIKEPNQLLWEWKTFLPRDDAPQPTLLSTCRFEDMTALFACQSFSAADDSGALMHQSLDDGRSWRSVSAGLPAAPLALLVSSNSTPGNVIAGVAGHGLYTFRRETDVWELLTSDPLVLSALSGGTGNTSRTNTPSLIPACIFLDNSGKRFVLISGQGAVCLSEDGGQHWEPRNTGLPAVPIHDFAVDVHSGMWYAACGAAGLYQSDDAGISWRLTGTNGCTTVICDPAAAGTVIFGEYDGGMFKSRDGGHTWKHIPVPPELLRIRRIYVSSWFPQYLFVTTYGAGLWYGVFDAAT